MDSTTTTVYGIKNCDSVRKARKWLDQNDVNYAFVDLRKDSVPLDKLQYWLDQVGPDTLINKRGTTWRQLNQDTRDAVASNPAELLSLHPTLIKRPVIEYQTDIWVGFDADVYGRKFA